MNFTRDDKEVVKAFMEQREMKSFKCKTDGQSFFSGDLRIAEHYPYGDGTASTLLYDFTERGGRFIDRHTQWLVYQIRNLIPRQNVVRVSDAQEVGLVPRVLSVGGRNENPFGKAQS